MESRLLPIFTFLSVLVLVFIHAAAAVSTPQEDYWKKVLPSTPMPGAIRDSLKSTNTDDQYWTDDKSTSVEVGKGGVHVNTGKPHGGGTNVNVGHGGGVGVRTNKGTNVNVGHGNVGVHSNKPGKGGADVSVGGKGGGVGVNAGKPGKRTSVGVGKGGVGVHTGAKGKPVNVGVHPGPNPFNYKYAAAETQLHEDPKVALFFRQNDLKTGKSMNLDFFTTDKDDAVFLSRKEAESIPFSSSKMPDILAHYKLSPESEEAQVMKQTVKECEEKGIQGEDKYCATSLEGMVDYTVSKLGKNVRAGSTEVVKNNHKQVRPQKYTVTGVRKMNKINGDDEAGVVVCHKQRYAYAVFYCHQTKSTMSYEVEMVGENGAKVKAEAICHKDTSKWNPKHLAFQVLKVKPGTVPVCHFLPQDHLVWVPKY